MKRIIKIILLMLLTMPALAFADSNIFEPVLNDMSLTVLSAIFGGLISPFISITGADPLGSGITTFNGCVLIVGGVLVAYTILVGTVSTAHDGEMLGKKFSSVWVPIRTGLGTALVIPVVKGTYCLMQLVVAWIIVQGVGLADNVWSVYTKTENLGNLASAGLQNIQSARQLGYSLFQSQVCVSAINKVIAESKESLEVIRDKGNNLATVKQFADGNSDILNFGMFGNGENTPYDDYNCGSANIPRVANVSNNPNPIFGLSDSQARASAITASQYNAANALVKTMQGYAESFVNGGAISTSQIDSAINDYQNAVAKEASAQILSLDEYKTLGNNASKDGWFLAGGFYTKISKLSDDIQSAMSNIGTASGPVSLTNNLSDVLGKYDSKLTSLLKTSKMAPINGGFGVSAENHTDKSWASLVKSNDFDGLMKKVFVTSGKLMVPDNSNPLIGMKSYGIGLLTLTSSVFGLVFAGDFVMSALPTIIAGNLGVVMPLVLSFVSFGLATPLFLAGLILTYILPNLPFFLWFGATIGWLVLCVEAILAAPMWAVMHLTANGDDMVGSGAQGYRLVLSLMLRPVLMILGLVVSFVMLSVVGQLFTKLFFEVFTLNNDGNFIVWIGGLIISPIIYLIGMYILIKKLFSMIHIIPDELLKWFGGGGSQMGTFANTIGGEQGGMAGAGAALLGGHISKEGNELLRNKANAMMDKLDKAPKKIEDKAVSNASADSLAGNKSQEDGNMSYSDLSKKSSNEFTGEVTNFGSAPYQDDPANKDSFFVELKNENGDLEKVWGVDLAGKAGSEFNIGDNVSLKKASKEDVVTTDKKGNEIDAIRNKWEVNKKD